MSIRLIKVSKDLNVGINSLVEFLQKKGFEIESNPNTKIDDEQYDLIMSCSPGPYMELFARYPHSGWTVWGDEAAEQHIPRGRVHKGYEGGAIMPEFRPNEHIDGSIADAIGRELRTRYEEGCSIRELAEETGYSIQRVRMALDISGAVMRPRGRTANIRKAS